VYDKATPYRFHKLVKRHGKPALRITQIGWVKVHLPGRQEDLTLVVSRLAGVDKPMMLLTLQEFTPKKLTTKPLSVSFILLDHVLVVC